MSKMPTKSDILQFLGNRKVTHSDRFQRDILIKRQAPISDAQPGDITFCGAIAKNSLKLLAHTHSSLLIVDKNIYIDKATLFHSGIQAIILLLNLMMNVRKNRAILDSRNLPYA